MLLFSSYLEAEEPIVLATKRVVISGYDNAFNPSMIAYEQGYLLTFRYIPNPTESWISYIGIVLLDKAFEPTAPPQLLNSRKGIPLNPSQSEDARILLVNKELHLIYNDNIQQINPTNDDNRDMFVAKLKNEEGQFQLVLPQKLVNVKSTQTWEKNWVPFEWKKELLLAYTISPHEILRPKEMKNSTLPFHKTFFKHTWRWGTLRGGTPAVMIDGEYLSFFHSSMGVGKWHTKTLQYFLGAYTFSPEPPFRITKMSARPIITKEFYEPSNYYKKVIFPGGFVEVGNLIYLAYGKDDSEIWIATIDKKNLKKSLAAIQSYK